MVSSSRVAACPEGAAPPSFEDSYFTVLLVAFALFGEAIAGPIFRGENAPDLGASERFRAWLARLVQGHLEG